MLKSDDLCIELQSSGLCSRKSTRMYPYFLITPLALCHKIYFRFQPLFCNEVLLACELLHSYFLQVLRSSSLIFPYLLALELNHLYGCGVVSPRFN
ncbi:hypothetical protein P879_09236 [Paragonimus westermani]|uniref:Uncharacterized protein n=1 Tax=Paragonimus westermani TaxID=34504 RepID=A0A8T0DVC0_9TREM|nr:hypothetical protein P879_09236 [Paragonimus westermani]